MFHVFDTNSFLSYTFAEISESLKAQLVSTPQIVFYRPVNLFRQSLNRTGNGNGNLINTNGLVDIMLSFHTAKGTGQGQGT